MRASAAIVIQRDFARPVSANYSGGGGRFRRPRGFALVVTLSLMILLTLLAVGLLGLAAVELRGSAAGKDLATARANARLALQLALGDLQKAAGPDQRITARADLLDADHSKITGVWDSWAIDATDPPTASDYLRASKEAKFRGWLVSTSDPKDRENVNLAAESRASAVTLLGGGTLGTGAPNSDHVSASRLKLGSANGAVAWAVLDEGVKARINMSFRHDASSVGAQTAQLGTGQRPATEMMLGLGGLKRDHFEAGSQELAVLQKGVSNLNFALAGESIAPGIGKALQPLAHDFTLHSVGLFTDVARGGLKQDFHLLTENRTLPPDYRRKGIYQSMLGLDESRALSDPIWDSFQQFATLHRDQVLDVGGVPSMKGQWPPGWQAATPAGPGKIRINPKPGNGVLMMPTIAKVQMLFSLVARDIYDYPPPAGRQVPASAPTIHSPQGDHFRGTQYQYDLHLLYTPIVTLHNPYNVALEFNKMRIEFANVPIAATVYRNGIAQNRGLAPMERMWADNEGGQTSKIFGLNLKTKSKSGSVGSSTFRLLPGETKMFSPYIDPNRTWRQDLGDRKFWDIYVGDGKTSNVDAIPGWRGDGIGFDLDWWNPSNVRISGPDKENGRWEGCLGLSRTDEIHVEFAPLSEPKVSANKFVIRMTAAQAANAAQLTTGAIEINYERPDGLQRFLNGEGKTLRFPKEGTVNALEMLDHSSTPIKNLKGPKAFALMTVQAKTTSAGRDLSDEDGRHSTKPWSFAHASAGASTQKILTEHPANHSHEIDLQRLDNGTSNVLQIDPMDRANFITGHTSFNGLKFGTIYDVPLHPLQTLASLNGANPGGASGFLPRFAQPIGNSWAHPFLPANALSVPGGEADYLDHSFLLNLALYDRFYFSGLAAQTGPFGSGKTLESLAADFSSGESLDDPRLIFRPPSGKTSAEFTSEVSEADAHQRAAAWQLMQGSFNINSTSVAAWKAMLGSIHDSNALHTRINAVEGTTRLEGLGSPQAGTSRMSRFRLPIALGEEPRDRYWLGARELTYEELQALAENIVEQVRLRGPFLSMAEFVNRCLGSGETAQRGALQQAIDDSGVNQGIAVAADAGFEIPLEAVADYHYANPEAGAGASYQGAPGYLTQADLLNVLGNAATARSDTFTIRAYGEAHDSTGKVIATAWCEALVQRLPEWLDSTDAVEADPADLKRPVNERFGRRFHLISFRWLHPEEV